MNCFPLELFRNNILFKIIRIKRSSLIIIQQSLIRLTRQQLQGNKNKMDFQDTLMTNKWNQSFTTPDKNKNNITLQTNPSSNTFVSFNFSKSNILNESSQIPSKQLISAFKIQQKEEEKSDIYNSNQIEVVSNKITTKQISDFLQTKKLLSYYFNQYANMKIKQKMSKNKNKDLIIKVYNKQKEVARYREKVIKSIKSKQNIKKHYKSEYKLKKKQKINQFYEIKREIKIIDNQIESTITQIVEIQKILKNKEEKQSARYSKNSQGQKKLKHKTNIKKLNKKQPIIYLPYFYPVEQQYPPYFGFSGNNNQYNNSLKSSTKRMNVNPQANDEQQHQNEIVNVNSFGLFNKNLKNIPKNNKIITQNTQKITNKYNNQSVWPLGNFINKNKIAQNKKSLRSSVKWQGDQQDMDVIRMISESQKLKKSSQNREGIQESVININMEASLQKTQNSIKQKNILNKYQISPREKYQEKPLQQSTHNQKQFNKLSIHQLSPRKDQNVRQSSIHIDVDSDQHSRSISYQDSAKDDMKKSKEKRVISPPVNSSKNYQPIINKYQSQFVRISQEQNSGISTPMFTGKQSPNLKLTNPIFQLENLVQSKAGEHFNNKEQKKIKNQTIHSSPDNIQQINANSSDQSFMQISLQVQSKISKQQFKNQSSAKSVVLKNKKQQKKMFEQQKGSQKLNEAQSEQNDSEDDFMDNINLLAVSRISKQQQKSTKSEDKNKQKQSQENIGAMDSQLRISNPSKIIKKGNPQFKQSNAKNSQRLFSKIPMTVQQQDEYQEQLGPKKISTARNFASEPVVASIIESQNQKGTI